MLDRSWPASPDQQPTSEPRSEQQFIGYADVAAFLRRNLLLIATCLILSLSGAVFYIVTTEPLFVAASQILIEPKVPQLIQQQQSDVNLSMDTAQLESQMAVLRSEKIAKMVIDQLNLYEDPQFNRLRSPPFKERLRKMAAMIVDLAGLRGASWSAPLVNFADAHTTAAESTGSGELQVFERDRLTIGLFEDSLEVRRVGVSYALEISFRAFDPQQAANIANATADAFIREQLETKSEAAREGSAWMEQRIAELRRQMNVATQVAQEFRAKHDYSVGTLPPDALQDRDWMPSDASNAESSEPTLEELEANAETYKRMYESFLEAFTASVHRQSYPVADARIITAATPPLRPSTPRKKLALAFGMLVGIMAGTGLAFMRHMLDRSVLSPHQIREDLGLECLGQLPSVFGRRKGFGRLDEVVRAPRSPYSDGLRRVEAAIEIACSDQQIRSIGVISVSSDNGKSEFVTNLTTLFSMSGPQALLIDANIYEAELTASLASSFSGRIASAQKDQGSVSGSVTPLRGTCFDFVPNYCLISSSGRDTLEPKQIEILLRSLHGYERIILDLPPITTAVDGVLVSSVLDAVIIVVERGRTSSDLVAELVRSMRAAKTPILGVVMTKSRSTTSRGNPLPAKWSLGRRWAGRLVALPGGRSGASAQGELRTPVTIASQVDLRESGVYEKRPQS